MNSPYMAQCYEKTKNSMVNSIQKSSLERTHPVSIYLSKGNSRNTRTKREICSKLIIKIPEQSQDGH